MKLKFTNGGNEQSDIEIKGKCKITNYDPREKNPFKEEDLTVTVDGKNSSIMNGRENQENSQEVKLDDRSYSIFTTIAGLDGDGTNLTQDDLKIAKEMFADKGTSWNQYIKNIRFDSRAGVATIVMDNDKILRIDFKTSMEKVSGFFGRIFGKSDDEEVKDYEYYFKYLALFESSGNPENMSISKEKKQGYAGLYQIGEEALYDLGIYTKKTKKWNNDWHGEFKPNEYGINSLNDFLGSPEKQKEIFIDLMKRNWEYIQVYGLDNYIGKTINGHYITESGLLAGAHLVGITGLTTFLESDGEKDPIDGNKRKVSEYIDAFASYNMSEITGIEPGKFPSEIKYENVSYTVESGDTLYSIALRFKTSIDKIMEANNLQNDSLSIGQYLIVPKRIEQ